MSVGGAPIYGADAIAGTVNIILKKDYEGLQLDADAGVSNQHDAWNYRFRVLGGLNFADGRGNVTIAGEAYKADGLVGNARPVYGNNSAFLSPPLAQTARTRPCTTTTRTSCPSIPRAFR